MAKHSKNRLNKMDVYLIIVGLMDLAVLIFSFVYSWTFEYPLSNEFYSFCKVVLGGEAFAGVVLAWIKRKEGSNGDGEE